MTALSTAPKRRYGVMVVEDSKTDARMILQALLQDDRHLQVTVLPDGNRASAHLRGPTEDELPFGPPDLVLLDLDLPGRSGLDLLTELKASPFLREVPVVVFTGSEEAEEIQRCYQLGANCVVNKPVESKPFLRVVQCIERYWLDVIGPRARSRAQRNRQAPEPDDLP